jgi:arylsulfatase A-like enzyme
MGLGQGFATYRHLREGKHDAIHVLSDRLNEEAFTWLDNRDQNKPFFLYLHATDPHSPYTPRERFLNESGHQVSDPSIGLIENVKQLRRNEGTEQQIKDLVALYDAEIAQNDHHFGALLEELERRGILEETLVVLVSDHGEEFFDHGWWQHGKTLYEEQLSVPLVMRFPEGLGRGVVVDEIAQHIDILPTVLETAGVEAPATLPGRSLLGSLDAEGTGAPPYAISYLDLDGRAAESVLTDDGKLILHHYEEPTRGQLLFDLIADPAEQANLWSQRPVLTGHLLAALRAFNLTHQERLDPEQGEFDEEVTERLKALGYLN